MSAEDTGEVARKGTRAYAAIAPTLIISQEGDHGSVQIKLRRLRRGCFKRAALCVLVAGRRFGKTYLA